jgi:uracil-DNA glycosylase
VAIEDGRSTNPHEGFGEGRAAAEEMLARLWADLDSCDGCRDPRFAESDAPAPARPFRPPLSRPILFVGEAPPITRGFWTFGNTDAVRRLLLPVLPAWSEALDWDSGEAIDWFVDAGFFFVQAMKWTLAHRSYLKLSTRQKCLAVDHAVEAHLVREIELIRPRAIIALGAGAWDACLLLAERYGQQPFQQSGVEAARLRHYLLLPPKEEGVPLHVTFLPGRINEALGRTKVIGDDVAVFLRCINDGKGCAAATRKVVALRATGPTVSNAQFRDLKRRMKAVGLWPQPKGMTFEQAVDEFVRRSEP